MVRPRAKVTIDSL